MGQTELNTKTWGGRRGGEGSREASEECQTLREAKGEGAEKINTDFPDVMTGSSMVTIGLHILINSRHIFAKRILVL